ncbi:hypothetical protein BGZ96_001190 [Linnemannia gamsii]|uniref:Uncharacterized protein n=1 Tax=Linnemannia gamsii TaxID=64522 RepID=A0ABQ7JMM4_9FUNG|nr:hypothetical protein BGZ96_001190 [Linnemannia gamsii]
MTNPEGGFMTRKIHIPRQAWYQHGGTTLVRLPAAEAKISACHTITLMLEQMLAQSKRGMLNLMIGPPTPASSVTSFKPLGSPLSSGSSSGSSSSSSSFIAPYSPASPVSPSQISFHSTASSAVSSTASLAALVSQTPAQQLQPITPTTPTQSAFVTATTPSKDNKTTTDRNSGDNSNGSNLPSYNAIDTEQDRILLSKELEALESTALHIWAKLSKKLSFVHRPGKYFLPHAVNGAAGVTGNAGTNTTTRHQQQHQSQDMLSSQKHEYQDDSSKEREHHHHHHHHHHAATNAVGSGTDLKSQWKHFSKSVQKSMANDKVDDTTTYSDSVLRLFQSATILETMYRHYTALSATSSGSAYFASSLQTYYAQIINRLRRIGDFLNLVICAFVVRDLGEFLAKYNKRVSAWIVE